MEKEIKYLFIDGAYFRKVLERFSRTFFDGKTIPIDYNNKIRSDFYKTFYYDCLSPKKNDETEKKYKARIRPQEEFFDSLRMLNGFHVYEGTTAGEGGKIRQKKVDTMIAVDMLTHSFRGNMDKATLLTGDLDFKPLIDALIQQGMYITLWYHPLSTSKELFHAADSRIEFNLSSIFDLASDDFRKNNQVFPRDDELDKKDINGCSLVKKGKINLESELGIEIYKHESGYRAIYQRPIHVPERKPFIHLRHDSQEFLENYIIDRFQKQIDWME